ncbi:hypothetical protein [Pseudoalteromonas atlantica]|uniref:hypothetical protein n=1 Tax=Pseudoalteromonas atlantica TaxID=288 RepID=UPI0037356C6C
MPAKNYKESSCELDCKLMSLTYRGKSLKLSSKVHQLLVLFISNEGNIVSKEEAAEAIWQGNEGVAKKGFANATWVIKKTFKELGIEDEIFITLPKHGYQLVFPVHIIEDQPANPLTAKKLNNQYVFIGAIFAILALLTVGIANYFFVSVDNEPPSLTMPTKEKVTNYGGIEEHIAVSHDGEKMAIQWRADTLLGKIYIKNLTKADSPLTLFSYGHHEEASPAWSLNDDKLAYVRIGEQGGCQLRVRYLIDNKDEMIADDCFYMPYKRVVSWSNVDNNSLVYSAMIDNRVALKRYSMEDNNATQITFPIRNEIDFAPRFISGDQQIAFIREHGDSSLSDLMLQDNSSMEVTLFLKGKPSIIDFDYSKQKSLFYVNWVNGAKAMISKINKKGEHLPAINSFFRLPSSINISDTTQKLFVTDHISKEYIAQIAYEDQQMVRKISSSSRDMYAKLSKTDGHIVFMSNRSNLWSVWKNDKTISKDITKDLGNVSVPAISPISNEFAVNITKAGIRNLYIGNVQSENFRVININGLSADNLSWSRDGNFLYFKGVKNGTHGTYKLNINSNELTLIDGLDATYTIEGEDDSVLYFSKFNETGLWRLDRQTMNISLVTPKLEKYDFGSFYYEQDYVYYLSRSKEYDYIERININNYSKEEVVAKFPANTVRKFFGLSSADGQSFLTTLKVANEADVFNYDL